MGSDHHMNKFVRDLHETELTDNRGSEISITVPTRTSRSNGQNQRSNSALALRTSNSRTSLKTRGASVHGKMDGNHGIAEMVERGVERNIRKILYDDDRMSVKKKTKSMSLTRSGVNLHKPHVPLNRHSAIVEQ